MPNIDIYGPMSKDSVEPAKLPDFDVVLQKSLMGDDSDNIPGYAGIGEKRAAAMARDLKAMEAFFNSEKAIAIEGDKRVKVGRTLFENNLKLIDLSGSPHVDENTEYVNWVKERDDLVYNYSEMIRILRKYNLSVVLEDIHTNTLPFMRLATGKSSNGK
jgi:5'-3' exonuclease